MLSCQAPEGHVLEARGEEDINSGCHRIIIRRRTGLAQFQLRRVFVGTAQPHKTDLHVVLAEQTESTIVDPLLQSEWSES